MTNGLPPHALAADLPITKWRLFWLRTPELLYRSRNVFKLLRLKTRPVPTDPGSPLSSPCGASSQHSASDGGRSGGAQRPADRNWADRHRQDDIALLPATHPVP